MKTTTNGHCHILRFEVQLFIREVTPAPNLQLLVRYIIVDWGLAKIVFRILVLFISTT